MVNIIARQLFKRGPAYKLSQLISKRYLNVHEHVLKRNLVDETCKNKLIYEGKLTKRILYLKGLSILSSVGLTSSYGYVISQKSFSVALAGVGIVFIPFLLSPFIIAWFFKRYITKLYYNPIDDTYTAHHFGLLLNKKICTYKKEQVVRSEVTSMLNSFTVDKKPFFLWEDDLIDVESVDLYKRMIGLSEKLDK